jgi:hypothetical protein
MDLGWHEADLHGGTIHMDDLAAAWAERNTSSSKDNMQRSVQLR